MKYTDIKSHQDACNYLKISSDLTQALSRYPEEEREVMQATLALLDIGNAINKITKFKPDLNKNIYYIPLFTSSGFFPSDCDFWGDCGSAASSRLVFKTRKISNFVGKTFESTYLKSRK